MKAICISDTHGKLPVIPECDLLLIAGDICPHAPGGPNRPRVGSPEDIFHQSQWLAGPFRDWLEKVPATHTIATWGNHDFIGQRRPDLVLTLPWHLLIDQGIELEGLKIWGTPWQPWFYDWAFNAPDGPEGEAFLAEKFRPIPRDVDILIAHGPPYGYGDLTDRRTRVGSRALVTAIETRSPQLVVTGHIHSACGVYRHPSGCKIVNASVLDEDYKLVNPPIAFELDPRSPS